MKAIHTIFLTLFFLGCSATKNLQFNTNNCQFDDKIIERDKNLNITTNEKRVIDSEGGIILVENDSLIINISRGYGEYDKRYKNKLTSITKLINYDMKTLKVSNSYSFFNKGDFSIGNEYFYNDKGEVIKTIDHNQYGKYPICYKDIIKIATKKMGKNYYVHALSRDSLSLNNDLKYIWHVSMSDSITKSPTVISKYYKIDAKTGEILKQGFVRQI